jgi:hypothetical protein
MDFIVRLLDLACGRPLRPEDQGRARRLQLVIAALLSSLFFALIWGVAVGIRSPRLMLDNTWKVPLVVFLSSAFAVPAGLVTWKLSDAKCRATDLLLGFASGVFTGTLVLAVLGPVVALYYESSQWAGPILAQAAIGVALLTGTVVFSRGLIKRLETEGKMPGKRNLLLSIAAFKAVQVASLLQLLALVSPILPEHTRADHGIDGLAHQIHGEIEGR